MSRCRSRAARRWPAWRSASEGNVLAVYASPLQRTMETARILSGAHALQPIAEPALREIDYGHWEGRSRSEVERDFRTE